MLQSVCNRLIATNVFRAVILTESIDQIVGKATAAESVSVFVAPWQERGLPVNQMTGAFQQIIDTQFVTAVMFRRHDDPRGAVKVLAFDAAKAAVEGAISGWTPDNAFSPAFLVGGEANGLGNGVSIFAQTWQTQRFLTGISQ